MNNIISENEIENIALSYLQNLGYKYVCGADIAPDGEHPERQYSEVVLVTRLRDAIFKLNPNITQEAREDALKKVLRTDSPNLDVNNEIFHKYLTDGVDVEVRTDGGIRGENVYIVDFKNPESNEFLAVNQFTVIEGNQNKRTDIILFVNGLPLVVIELKNAVDEDADIKSAYNQLQTYKQTIPSLFTYNELLIVSDDWDAKCGTLTSDFGRFMPWKNPPSTLALFPLGEGQGLRVDFDFSGLVNEARKLRQKQTKAEEIFWQLVRNRKFNNLKFRRQHQIGNYIADFYCDELKLVIEFDGNIHNTIDQQKHDSKRDKFLKSSKFKVIRFKNEEIINTPETVFNKIEKEFLHSKNGQNSPSPFGRGGNEGYSPSPFGRGGGEGLLEMEVMFYGMLNKKTLLNLISQFIVFEKSDGKILKKVAAYHQYYAVNKAIESVLRAAGKFPSFGGVGVVKERCPKDEVVKRVSKNYFNLPYNPNLKDRAKELRQAGNLSEVLFWNRVKNKQFKEYDFDRQKIIGNYIVDFYCNNCNVVIEIDGSSHDDKIEYDTERDAFLESLGLTVIHIPVVDVMKHLDSVMEMLFNHPALTGTPPKEGNSGHTITGAPPKEGNVGDRRGGVVWHTQGSGKSLSMVFFSGKLIIEPQMENPTLVILTDRNDLDEQLYDTFKGCQQLLRQQPQQAESRRDLKQLLTVASGGIVVTTIQKFMPETDDDVELPTEGMVCEPAIRYIGAKVKPFSERKNIVVIADEAHRSQYDFIDGFARKLRDALPNATFIGFTGTPIESTDRNTQAVFGNYVDIYDIHQAVADKATVPIFYESRLAKVHFAEEKKVHLDEQFLQELKNMPQKNLAVELLKKLLKDEIKRRSKINLVESKKFSEMLEDAIKRYHNGMIDTVEFLEKVLIPFAEQMKDADRRGEELGLDYREYAFYTALEVNNSAVAILGDEILKHIAQELLSTVRSSATIDWTIKESVQATLRRNVRRILRKFSYPPDLQEKAVDTVISQAKMLAEDLLDNEKL